MQLTNEKCYSQYGTRPLNIELGVDLTKNTNHKIQKQMPLLNTELGVQLAEDRFYSECGTQPLNIKFGVGLTKNRWHEISGHKPPLNNEVGECLNNTNQQQKFRKEVSNRLTEMNEGLTNWQKSNPLDDTVDFLLLDPAVQKDILAGKNPTARSGSQKAITTSHEQDAKNKNRKEAIYVVMTREELWAS